MRILLTNDDGIDMVGLHVLARAMREHGDVVIAAPETEQSGMGAAFGPLHLLRPELARRSVDGIDEAWAVTGTPALCVFFARLGVFGDPFDLVVSGINPGANVGRAVYHSGTVGAALTARSGGISAVAVSQETPDSSMFGQGTADHVQYWDTAAAVARAVVGGLIADAPDEPVVLNVNVPNCALAEVKGWREAEVGTIPPRTVTEAILEPIEHRPDRFRVTMSWGEEQDLPVEIDGGAVRNGEVAISSLGTIGHVGHLSGRIETHLADGVALNRVDR